uniref:uncharacterized protein isoform X2 n=1 Tax=Myxine glutinosa TaxID=7769 RepID=UPI00358EA8B1
MARMGRRVPLLCFVLVVRAAAALGDFPSPCELVSEFSNETIHSCEYYSQDEENLESFLNETGYNITRLSMSNLQSEGDEGTFQLVFSNLTWDGESVQLQHIVEATKDYCLLLHICPQLCERDLCTKLDGLFLVFTPVCGSRLVVDLCLHACRAHLLLPSMLLQVFVAAPMEVVQQVQIDVWYHIVNGSVASDNDTVWMTTTKCSFTNASATNESLSHDVLQRRGMLLQYHLASDEKVSVGQPVGSQSSSLLDFLTSFKLFEGLSSALNFLMRNNVQRGVLSNWSRRAYSRTTFDQIPHCESMMLSAIGPQPDCQLEFFNKSGNLYPPGFPDHYQENVTCQWTIHAQLAKRIMVKICNFGTPSNCCEIEDRIVFEELSPNGVNTTLWACWGQQVSLYSPLGQGVKVSLVVGGSLPQNVSTNSRRFWGEYRVLDKYEMLDITWLACDEWGLRKNVGSDDQTLDELDRTINDEEFVLPTSVVYSAVSESTIQLPLPIENLGSTTGEGSTFSHDALPSHKISTAFWSTKKLHARRKLLDSFEEDFAPHDRVKFKRVEDSPVTAAVVSTSNVVKMLPFVKTLTAQKMRNENHGIVHSKQSCLEGACVSTLNPKLRPISRHHVARTQNRAASSGMSTSLPSINVNERMEVKLLLYPRPSITNTVSPTILAALATSMDISSPYSSSWKWPIGKSNNSQAADDSDSGMQAVHSLPETKKTFSVLESSFPAEADYRSDVTSRFDVDHERVASASPPLLLHATHPAWGEEILSIEFLWLVIKAKMRFLPENGNITFGHIIESLRCQVMHKIMRLTDLTTNLIAILPQSLTWQHDSSAVTVVFRMFLKLGTRVRLSNLQNSLMDLPIPGSIRTPCPVWVDNVNLQVEDVDECEEENLCAVDAVCENTVGSYMCRCIYEDLDPLWPGTLCAKQVLKSSRDEKMVIFAIVLGSLGCGLFVFLLVAMVVIAMTHKFQKNLRATFFPHLNRDNLNLAAPSWNSSQNTGRDYLTGFGPEEHLL